MLGQLFGLSGGQTSGLDAFKALCALLSRYDFNNGNPSYSQTNRFADELLRFLAAHGQELRALSPGGPEPTVNGKSFRTVLSESLVDDIVTKEELISDRLALWRFFKLNCGLGITALNVFSRIKISQQIVEKTISDISQTGNVSSQTQQSLLSKIQKAGQSVSEITDSGTASISEALQKLIDSAKIAKKVCDQPGWLIKGLTKQYILYLLRKYKSSESASATPSHPRPTRPSRPTKPPIQSTVELPPLITPGGPNVYLCNGKYTSDIKDCGVNAPAVYLPQCTDDLLVAHVPCKGDPSSTPASGPTQTSIVSDYPATTADLTTVDQFVVCPDGTRVPPGEPCRYTQIPTPAQTITTPPPSISPWCFGTITRPGLGTVPARWRTDGTGNKEFQMPGNPAWYPTELPATPCDEFGGYQGYRPISTPTQDNGIIGFVTGGGANPGVQAPIDIPANPGMNGLPLVTMMGLAGLGGDTNPNASGSIPPRPSAPDPNANRITTTSLKKHYVNMLNNFVYLEIQIDKNMNKNGLLSDVQFANRLKSFAKQRKSGLSQIKDGNIPDVLQLNYLAPEAADTYAFDSETPWQSILYTIQNGVIPANASVLMQGSKKGQIILSVLNGYVQRARGTPQPVNPWPITTARPTFTTPTRSPSKPVASNDWWKHDAMQAQNQAAIAQSNANAGIDIANAVASGQAIAANWQGSGGDAGTYLSPAGTESAPPVQAPAAPTPSGSQFTPPPAPVYQMAGIEDSGKLIGVLALAALFLLSRRK